MPVSAFIALAKLHVFLIVLWHNFFANF